MSLPNILYIHTHDAGRYVQPYGYNVPTPHIQKLAQEGITFRQAFCTTPTCSPSRASLVTGMYPHCNGMTGLANMGWSLNDYKQHIVHTLRSAGYKSALIGQQHVASDPKMIGYDEVVSFPYIPRKDGGHTNRAERAAPEAVTFLKNKPKQPFFLTVGFDDTHREWPEPGPDNDPRWQRPPAPIPDNPITRLDFAGYRTSARKMDWGMGQVLDALEETGIAENTLVICTTDHGIGFPRMKSSLYDTGTGVMLIMRGPGGFEGGKVCDALVSQVDIFPTICEILNIESPEWLQGRSIMPLIKGEKDEVNDHIFSEINYHGGYDPTRAVRTKRFKYIRHFEVPAFPARTSNQRGGLTLNYWLDKGWREQQFPDEELYDLTFDPNENNNLAETPEAQNMLDSMRSRLDRFMKWTDDPLLSGPVPAPPGASVYDVDANLLSGPGIKP